MCLSGVDYFSTLAYQPGIAVAVAGALAPVATVVLVLVTMCGAVPVYRRIAAASPDGLGSVGMLAGTLRGWWGKAVVLLLLGFAACDFMITVSLSSSDAATHLLSSSSSPWLIPVTLVLVGALAGVLIKGFTEAVRVSVVLVSGYLGLTVLVVGDGIRRIISEPGLIADWSGLLVAQHPNPIMIVALAVVIFPRLALGMSGFETGVSVIPLIRPGEGGRGVPPRESRVRGGQRLVVVSALVMSVFLILSSLCVTVLVPAEDLRPGGPANGRALAWLAHQEFGPLVGNVYDAATIAVLWFAGASAMAGLLALIPRYLPAYGMAPEWARRSRPMVLVLTGIAVVVVLVFRADVDAQAGAYATGVLVLLLTGALAVTLEASRHPRRGRVVFFGLVTTVMGYTLVDNVLERPEGLKVAARFIVLIIVVSTASRAWRSFERRSYGIRYDAAADTILRTAVSGSAELRLVPCPAPDDHQVAGATEIGDICRRREQNLRLTNHLCDDRPLVFLDVRVADPSEFTGTVEVEGYVADGVPVLQVSAAAVPNAVAALALDARDFLGVLPDIYFEWGQDSPAREMLRFLATGRGNSAAVTREVLRRAEPVESRRPRVHVV